MAAPIVALCDFCGKESSISHECISHHYICDDCMALSAVEYIKIKCLEYKGVNPIELAVSIMNLPLIKMHGPEHHFIVPAVLLTCVHNKLGQSDDLRSKLELAELRATCETPDACVFATGSCGAADGAGVFLSMHTGRPVESEDEWSLTNALTASCLKKIAESGGPRCCKRDTYLSLEAAIDFLKERFGLELPKSEAKCTFSLRNRSCKREDCNFYNLGFSIG
jgi:hypothetical protein